MNKKGSLIYQVLSVILLTVVVLFFIYKYANNTPDAKQFLERAREKNKNSFDSLNNSLAKEDSLHKKIEENINHNNFKTAFSLIDTLYIFGKRDLAQMYRAMVYAKQGEFRKAIDQYNIIIEKEEFPRALDKRAEVYIKLNRFDSAMMDYRKAYGYNFDYSLEIARTFELLHKKDSALKYYYIYLEHYPNDQITRKRIDALRAS